MAVTLADCVSNLAGSKVENKYLKIYDDFPEIGNLEKISLILCNKAFFSGVQNLYLSISNTEFKLKLKEELIGINYAKTT